MAARIPASSTALVMIDMINYALKHEDRKATIEASGIIPNSVALVAACRRRKIPIFWVTAERRADRHDVRAVTFTDAAPSGWAAKPPLVAGTWETSNIDELPMQAEDHVIVKPRSHAFLFTDLDLQLRARQVTTILLGGYTTNIGVELTARHAYDIHYDVIVLADCCFNAKREFHDWSLTKVIPNFARVIDHEAALALVGD